MVRQRYIKTKSNFTLKSKKQSTSLGDVYERDYMTISQNGNESNFKFVNNPAKSYKRKHASVKAGESFNENDVFNLMSKDSYIALNPDYESITDFAFYESAKELVKYSIKNIILTFPAEAIFFKNKKASNMFNIDFYTEYVFEKETYNILRIFSKSYKNYELIFSNGAKKEIIGIEIEKLLGEEMNPSCSNLDDRFFCKIYFDNSSVPENQNIEEIILYKRYNKEEDSWEENIIWHKEEEFIGFFEDLDGKKVPEGMEIRRDFAVNKQFGEIWPLTKDKEGNFAVDESVSEFKRKLVPGKNYRIGEKIYEFIENNKFLEKEDYEYVRIRPKVKYIEENYNKLNDFEKNLLNRNTLPLYTSRFLTPIRENEKVYSIVNYVWPNVLGYNPDIASSNFKEYANRLYKLGEHFDEFKCDNIWQTMVHDAIKNMDYSYIRNGVEISGSGFDDSRLKPMIDAWGFQYDFIKRYIDNIANSNNISYNFKNNTPDYFLKNKLSENGWEVKEVYMSNSRDVFTKPLYGNTSRGNNAIDANIFFMKALKLNSNYIFPRKGTKEAIRAVLSLFGFNENDYELNEFIRIAGPKTIDGIQDGYPTYETMHKYNAFHENYSVDETLSGLPVKKVDLIIEEEGEEKNKSYIIPWFENGQTYFDNAYFQMKGGWSEQETKLVNNIMSGEGQKDIVEIKRVLNKDDEFRIFDETAPVLRIVDDINSMNNFGSIDVVKNEVLYITNIDGLEEKYGIEDGKEKISMDEFSNYFVLKDETLSHTFGYNKSHNKYGWKNVLKKEFNSENLSTDAQRVLYLESLNTGDDGNNPHVGYYKYDAGEGYFDIFKKLIKNPNMSVNIVEQADEEKVKEIGYDISDYITDNNKVWFFEDTLREAPDVTLKVTGVNEGLSKDDPWGSTSMVIDDIKFDSPKPNLNATDPEENVIYPFNPEGPENDKYYDEAAANSILNTKCFQIVFYAPKDKSQEFISNYKKYITDTVMFYVKQLVPSTSIFRFVILGDTLPVVSTFNQTGTNNIMMAYNIGKTYIY